MIQSENNFEQKHLRMPLCMLFECKIAYLSYTVHVCYQIFRQFSPHSSRGWTCAKKQHEPSNTWLTMYGNVIFDNFGHTHTHTHVDWHLWRGVLDRDECVWTKVMMLYNTSSGNILSKSLHTSDPKSKHSKTLQFEQFNLVHAMHRHVHFNWNTCFSIVTV